MSPTSTRLICSEKRNASKNICTNANRPPHARPRQCHVGGRPQVLQGKPDCLSGEGPPHAGRGEFGSWPRPCLAGNRPARPLGGRSPPPEETAGGSPASGIQRQHVHTARSHRGGTVGGPESQTRVGRSRRQTQNNQTMEPRVRQPGRTAGQAIG